VSGLIRRLWRTGAGIAAVLLILLAIMVGLARLALVQVPEYRDQIEAWAGEALGWPVEIGSMDARLGLRGPELRFSNARVLARDRERAIMVASTGSMQFDTWSLLRGQLRPGAVRLAGVALRVERSAEGRWRLLGEDGPALGDGAGEMAQLADIPPGALRLEDVSIELEDFRQELGPWLFRVDALDVKVGGGQLSLAGTGRLPSDLGADVAISFVLTGQDASGRPSDWTAGLSFSALDLAAAGAAAGYADHLPAQGFIDGHLSAAADRQGLARIAGDVVARDLLPALVPTDSAEALADADPYDHFSTAFEWVRATAGWSVHLANIDVERAGRRWRSGHAALVFERHDGARRVEATADLIELEDLWPAARWLPADARSVVAGLAPAGMLRALELHLDFPAGKDGPPEAHIEAGFERLSLAPTGRFPGIHNISGNIAGDFHGGTLEIDSRDATVDLPLVFREPLAFDSMEASLQWSRAGQGLRLRVAKLELANDDATISSHGMLEFPGGEHSPRLELEAVARAIRLDAAPRYLPVSIMPGKVVDWLDAAVLGGRVEEARAELRGALRDFPFRDGGGHFKVEFDITEGALDYMAGWPRATSLDAGVRFENEGLWAQVRSGRLHNVEAGPAEVSIADFATPVLLIQGEARGRLAAFREFVLEADLLEQILGPGLEPAGMPAGRAAARVRLTLPFRAMQDYRAQVDLTVTGGVVAYGLLGEPLRNVNASLSIDNARVTAQGITATLAGSPLAADVSTGDDGAVRVDGHGHIDAPGLASVLRGPLDRWVSGAGEWQGFLQFPPPGTDAPFEAAISSGLEGFASALPEPFGKTASETRHLRAQAEFRSDGLTDLAMRWDNALTLSARLDRSGPEIVLRAVPGGVAGDIPGVVFSGAVPRLDLGAWLELEGMRNIDAQDVPSLVAGGRLLIGELVAPMVRLGDALVDLARADDHWSVAVEAEHAAGQLKIPFTLYGADPVTARLQRLWLETSELTSAAPPPESAAGEHPAARLHPASVPGLDIEVEDLRFGALRFGAVSARVLNEGDGIELIGLEGTGEGFMFQAEGRSRLSDTVDQSRLGVRITSDNVGSTLDFIGFRRSMEAQEGSFAAEVEWQGGLRGDWLEAITGTASIAIQGGRLVGVEPGAGRVFGLISIQALPRRLALDFKDVFGEGTSFDRISGDFNFENGNAFTTNLVMRGVSANMAVVGRTGLVARDYDQTAVIAADLGRTLPVAGAVVAGPAVAAALFLLSEVLRKPFQTQITYRLTGPWDNPVVEKLGAGSAPPLPSPPKPAEDLG
jgi:uncharacterized protein (TIGR02099 family)